MVLTQSMFSSENRALCSWSDAARNWKSLHHSLDEHIFLGASLSAGRLAT